MGHQQYTEEELLTKKYNDLFKISKALGIKTARRLKTDKLIEAILKCQREEATAGETAEETILSQDAEAVVEALGVDMQEEEEEEEEMLLDVQFPECGSQDSLDSLTEATKNTGGSETNTEPEPSKAATPAKRHKRSGTYDVEEEEEEEKEKEEGELGKGNKMEQEQEVEKREEQGAEKRKHEEEEEEEETDEGKKSRKKRQRSSTFSLTTDNEVTLPIDEKETEENSEQLSKMLASQVTVRGGRRHGTPSGQAKGGRKATTRLSITPSAKRRRESVTITPSAPAPALRPSRKSQGTPVGSPALRKTTAANTTTTAAAATVNAASKPVFNIGRGDNRLNEGTSQEDKQAGKGASSGIPRFLSYARRLKVPNFARIHEQAFQRMEGLDDYVDKRKARKDTVGSSTKKQQPNAKVFQPSVTSVKNLDFNFSAEDPTKNSGSNGVAESDGALPVAPSPAKPLNAAPHQPSPRSARRTSTMQRGAGVSQRTTRLSVKPGRSQLSSAKPDVLKKSPRVTSKAPPKTTKQVSPKSTKKASPKTIPGSKVSPTAGQKGSPQTGRKSHMGQMPRPSLKPVSGRKVSTIGRPVFGSHLKENQQPGKQSVSSPMVGKQTLPSEATSPGSVRKRMQDYSRSLANRGTGYVPYKGAVKPIKDRSDLKKLAERKPKVKSSKEIREGQRGILKGVRLNKRFELQMANRGIKLD